MDHPALSYSHRCSSPSPIKVRGLSGLSDKNTSKARREPLSHLFEDEKQQGVFICTWVHSAQSPPPGLAREAPQLVKNNNKTHPFAPLSRSFQEKRSVLTLLGVHVGENQACSLTENVREWKQRTAREELRLTAWGAWPPSDTSHPLCAVTQLVRRVKETRTLDGPSLSHRIH